MTYRQATKSSKAHCADIILFPDMDRVLGSRLHDLLDQHGLL